MRHERGWACLVVGCVACGISVGRRAWARYREGERYGGVVAHRVGPL